MLEVWIVVARRLSTRFVLAFWALVMVCLPAASIVQGAQAGGLSLSQTSRQPQFRPLGHAGSEPGENRQRQGLSGPRVNRQGGRPAVAPRSGQQAPFSQERAGARKAVPVTRGQDLGLRFRPDERASPYGQVEIPGVQGGAAASAPDLQSQFRPTEPRRKRTYEELQAESAAEQQPPPIGPAPRFPGLPPPLPSYPPLVPPW
jgi:hypothetical protein